MFQIINFILQSVSVGLLTYGIISGVIKTYKIIRETITKSIMRKIMTELTLNKPQVKIIDDKYLVIYFPTDGIIIVDYDEETVFKTSKVIIDKLVFNVFPGFKMKFNDRFVEYIEDKKEINDTDSDIEIVE